MWTLYTLAQQPAPSGGPSAATIFYITLLVIFVTAIVTTIATKRARDKCLKFFHGYHVTVERARGQTIWGRLKVFSSGIEIVLDQPYVDTFGQKKTSYLMYQPDIDQQLLSIFRFHDELDAEGQRRRQEQVRRTFNPGPMRRLWRNVRNLINTLRDAFNQAIGVAVGQYQRVNPTAAVLANQASNVTQLGQTLLGRLANAYEPLLEQYVGQPVILDVADPINPNNVMVQYAGYLADYTQQFIAIFNVHHATEPEVTLQLPDVEQGDFLPPLPPPPPPGGAAPALPPPLKVEHNLAIRIDGRRLSILNTAHHPMAVRRLVRQGYEPFELGMIIPPRGTLELPARDARGGVLVVQPLRCLDVVAARRLAVVRHAGELLQRRGLMEEWNLDQLPLVPRILGNRAGEHEESDRQPVK